MKPNQACHTRSQKLMQFVKTVADVGVVETAVVEDVGVVVIRIVVVKTIVRGGLKLLLDRSIREPNILTFPQVTGRGAVTISSSGKTRTFVLSQGHVRGKMCS